MRICVLFLKCGMLCTQQHSGTAHGTLLSGTWECLTVGQASTLPLRPAGRKPAPLIEKSEIRLYCAPIARTRADKRDL